MQQQLFEGDESAGGEAVDSKAQSKPKAARVVEADRYQTRLETLCLDELVSEDHPVRDIWAYVCKLDLEALYARIGSVETKAGRPATDPRILLALWIYATSQGVGSARRLEQLCVEHAAYRWICGGVNTNYHTLSDFRNLGSEFLNQLLTQSVGVLTHAKLVKLERISQDGVRVRASASTKSFRKLGKLEEHLEAARQQVETLKQLIEEDPGAASKRERAARARASRERLERVDQALATVKKLREQKQNEKRKKHTPEQIERTSASSTDPEARIMMQPDGGWRPSYNVQFAADCDAHIVTAVDVSTQGNDRGLMRPVFEQHCERHGGPPKQWLCDGGYSSSADIEFTATTPTKLYLPVRAKRATNDSGAMSAWRKRMSTESGKLTYKLRSQTNECIHGCMRMRGLRQLPVRGLIKTRAIALLHALTHNILRSFTLGLQLQRT